MSERNNEPSQNAGYGLAGAMFGAEQAVRQAAGADVMRTGMSQFLGEAQRLSALPVAIKKGNLFEFIEAAKFNYDAALKSSSAVAEVTAALGDTTAPMDIVLRDCGGVAAHVQAKVSESSTYTSRVLSTEKYAGMKKLVPQDRAPRVRQISAGLAHRMGQRGDPDAVHYADTAANVQGELTLGDISSGGTDLAEAIDAATAPRRYALKMSATAIANEAMTAGAYAALGSAVLRGAIEAAKATLVVADGENLGADALSLSARGVLQSAIQGGATATLATTIRHTVGQPGLAKANVATALAAGMIDAGAAVYSFIRGEIAADELMHRLGQNGCGTVSGLYTGVVVGATLGPVGVLVGSLAGYLIATNTYQSCLAILDRARLAEEESRRAIALLEASRQQIAAETEAFERLWRGLLAEREGLFRASLKTIDAGLADGDPEVAVAGLSEFVGLCGLSLGFSDFDSFDHFMRTSTEPIVL